MVNGITGFEEQEFNVFCPKVLAGIRKVTDTIEDRSFKIAMVRAATGENLARFNFRKMATEIQALQNSLKLWAEKRRESIARDVAGSSPW